MQDLQEYLLHLTEVNRIVSGIANKSKMPKPHVQDIWNQVDKEVVPKHTHGVTDHYKQIGSIVRAKLGVPDTEEEAEPDAE